MERVLKFMVTVVLTSGLTSSAFAYGYGTKGSSMDDGRRRVSMMEEMAHAPGRSFDKFRSIDTNKDSVRLLLVYEKNRLLKNDTKFIKPTTIYKIDAAHSTIGFAVKHLQISTTRGKFADYTGTIHYDVDNLKAFQANVVIQVASIDTDNEKRDQHLISGDFFDAGNYPTITFKSNRLDKRGEGYVMVGDITIHGVTKELTFPVQIGGPVQSPFGQTVMALNAEVVINRHDFGISWSKSMDNGGLVVADDVTLIVELELHQEVVM